MRLTRIVPTLLRLPRERAVALPLAGQSAAAVPLTVLLVQLETDAGVAGIGFGCVVGSGRAMVAAIEDDLAPRLAGEDPLLHERLGAMVRSIDGAAYAFIDIALWDLKARAAGLPLWRLLGGLRDRAKVFSAEAGSASLNTADTIALGRAALARGIKGVRIGVPGIDPEADSQKILAVRDALGEDIWFAVSVAERYDYETALPMGRFIEEEVGADWFEDPLADGDVTSYSRLSSRIDTPLAVGSNCASTDQFVRLLESGTRAILRPDVLNVGGITPWLKIAALAELNHRPVVPHLLPEVGVHLACGLPGVQAAEFVPWLDPLFVEPLAIENGSLVPPIKPGLGLEPIPEALTRYGIEH